MLTFKEALNHDSTSRASFAEVVGHLNSENSQSRAFDTMSVTSGISATSDWSRTSYTSADFDASDDEIISINSEAAILMSRESSASSCKRKRLTSTEVDEEVESLFQDVSDDELDDLEMADNLSEKSFKPGLAPPHSS